MATVFRSEPPQDVPRRGPEVPQRPDDVLGHASALLRLCTRDAAVAAVLLAMVAVGVVARLAHTGRPGPLAAVLLPAVLVPYGLSAAQAIRSRRTMMGALSSVRAATGAPLDPGVPWTPLGLRSGVEPRVRDVALRRLLAAAHRCAELSWQAVVWGVVASVLFLAWTAVTAAGAGG